MLRVQHTSQSLINPRVIECPSDQVWNTPKKECFFFGTEKREGKFFTKQRERERERETERERDRERKREGNIAVSDVRSRLSNFSDAETFCGPPCAMHACTVQYEPDGILMKICFIG